MADQNWRMPAGMDEWLPPAAWRLEQIRRKVLDVFYTWGYEYIEPPIVEYLDALLVGGGDDIDLQTLKVVDQRSGRLLGVRADMTPQAVRIDAHSRPLEGIQRLCYAGNLVFANPASSVDTRVPLKAGAELFGADSLMADAELVALMVEVLSVADVQAPVVVLGHMGIYQSLTGELALDDLALENLFTAVQSKAESDIRTILPPGPVADCLASLPALMGGESVLADAETCFASVGGGALAALRELVELATLVRARCPDLALRFDLAELAGYGYHNGPVFSAYHADLGQALARGGRYDGIGADFGRARPATGFDVSLDALAGDAVLTSGIWAPWKDPAERAELDAQIARLRSAGEAVVAAIVPDDEPPYFCDRHLVEAAGAWSVERRS
jgi:ATP phosphoribosyltransferase regulatory subunit